MEHYRLINEEYKVWKKNCPFLYDLVSVHALEWPSLTCEWLPGRDTSSSSFGSTQKLLLGTHTTSGHQNYLLVVQVDLPLSPAECHGENQEARNGMQGIPSKLSLTQRINHDGEVNCARHMPQDPNVIATCTPSGQIHIFDIAKHPTTPAQQNTQARPQLKLKGHKREGYSLSFNLRKSGVLRLHLALSSSTSVFICGSWPPSTMSTSFMAECFFRCLLCTALRLGEVPCKRHVVPLQGISLHGMCFGL